VLLVLALAILVLLFSLLSRQHLFSLLHLSLLLPFVLLLAVV
jgi:hypothetical protein